MNRSLPTLGFVVVIGTGFLLAACMQTARMRTGAPHARKAADCALFLVPGDADTAARYDRVGVVTVVAPANSDPLDESIRRQVRPEACALGGDFVSFLAATSGYEGPLAQQGISFTVWGKKVDGQGSSPMEAATSFAAGPIPSASTASTVSTNTNSGPRDTANHARSPAHDDLDTRFAATGLLGFAGDHMNFGLGVRAGKTLENRIHVGGTFVYHFGDSTTASGYGYTATASFSAFYVGPEVGYDFALRPLTIRPYLGLGIASLSTTVTSNAPAAVPLGNSTMSGTKFVIWPGATAIYQLPASNFFVAGDLRFVTIPDGPAVGLYAMGGSYF